MFVLVFAVPALLVVVAGYAVGYALVEQAYRLTGADPSRTPELAGWATGLVLLAVVIRLMVARRRRGGMRGDRQRQSHQGQGHQK